MSDQDFTAYLIGQIGTLLVLAAWAWQGRDR